VTGTDRGSVLLEFALVSLVLSLILAASAEFGRLMFSAQALQDVARVAARELAVTPFPADPTFTFENALLSVFDPNSLVIDLDNCVDGDAATPLPSIDDVFAGLPLVNKALRPLMIVDHSRGLNLLRYPGALLASPGVPPGTCPTGGFTVGIPRVVGRAEDGVETIEWIPIIEEIPGNPPGTSPFSLDSPQGGLVALRINYPYQAGALSGFRESADGPFEPNLGGRIRAPDAELDDVDQLNPEDASGDLLPDESPDALSVGPYAGPFGLGRQLAFAGERVRPFRRLVSAQAIFRREVIGEVVLP
jgi:hypothetical protein